MRRDNLVLTGCVAGIFLAALEGTVVGTVMPTIVSELGGLARYNWVFAVYMVAAAVTMPIWAKLSDLHGPRRYFFAGVVVFLAGSMLAGTSRTIDQLIAFRVVQGIGAGALFSLPMTILGHHAAPERRGHMLGFAAATWGVAALLGPPVGALVTGFLSWRWIFYLNLPVGLAALYLVWRHFEDPEIHRRHRLDILGALLIMAWTFALMVGAQAYREQAALIGLTHHSWGLIVAGLIVPLIVVERRAREPIMPVALFRERLYRVANGGAFLMAFVTFSAIVFVPLMTTLHNPDNVLRAGLSLVPASLGWTTGSLVGGRLIARTGGRVLALFGTTTSALAFLAATQLTPDSSLWRIIPNMFPIGVGIGITSPAILVTLQNHLGGSGMGVVTGGVAFYRHLGGTLGITVLGLFVPAVASDARITAGIQHAFMAAAAIAVAAAVLLSRLPPSIFPETSPTTVTAAAEMDRMRVGRAFEDAK